MKRKIPFKPIGKGLLGAGAISVPVSTLALVIENRDNLEELKLDFTNKAETLQAANIAIATENNQKLSVLLNNINNLGGLVEEKALVTETLLGQNKKILEALKTSVDSNGLYIKRLDLALKDLEDMEKERFQSIQPMVLNIQRKVEKLVKDVEEAKSNSYETKVSTNAIENWLKTYGYKITINGEGDDMQELQDILTKYQRGLNTWLYNAINQGKEDSFNRLSETIRAYDQRLTQWSSALDEYKQEMAEMIAKR